MAIPVEKERFTNEICFLIEFFPYLNEKMAQGRLSVDSSTLTNQNILVQRIVCRRKVLPLQHGKETFFIRL